MSLPSDHPDLIAADHTLLAEHPRTLIHLERCIRNDDGLGIDSITLRGCYAYIRNGELLVSALNEDDIDMVNDHINRAESRELWSAHEEIGTAVANTPAPVTQDQDGDALERIE